MTDQNYNLSEVGNAVEPAGRAVWSPEARDRHLQLSTYDWRFRQYVQHHDALLRRASFDRLVNHDYFPMLRDPIQSWPTFVSRPIMDRLRHVSETLNRLVRQIPRRLFGNDPVKICDYFGLKNPAAVELLLAEPHGLESLLSRADIVKSATGFRCHEVNFGSWLGGWENAAMTSLMLEEPAIRKFFEQERIEATWTHTIDRLFDHIIEQGRASGVSEHGELNIALLPPAPQALRRKPNAVGFLIDGFRRRLDRAGGLRGRMMFCDLSDLEIRGADLYSEGVRTHVLIEMSKPGAFRQVLKPFKAGRLNLYNPPIQGILADKRNLALLSEHADASEFDADEKEVLSSVLPWTRRVIAGDTVYQGVQAAMSELLKSEQDRFVLKKGKSLGGQHVAVGVDTSKEKWRAMLNTALDSEGEWVVQELADSLTYVYRHGDDGCGPHRLHWGALVYGDDYSGVSLRVQSLERGRVINLTREYGVLFEVDEPGAAAEAASTDGS